MARTTDKTKKPSRLGRGLSSLMSGSVSVALEGGKGDIPSSPLQPVDLSRSADATGARPSGRVFQLPLDSIHPNPGQPRKIFKSESLAGLAESIKAAGVMQPVTVRRAKDGETYELVSGERRWRAARIAGFDQVPAIVHDLDDRQVAEWSLIENLQREDLNPIERAVAFRSLIDQFSISHEQIGKRVGVNRSTITNSLRLLTLDDEVQEMVRQDLMSTGQAKALASVADPTEQRLIARRAVAGDWPVRRIEQAVRKGAGGSGATGAAAGPDPRPKTAQIADLEGQLAEQIGTKVQIRPGRKKGSGTMTVSFYSLEQFDSLMERMGVELK
jgi:ParB family chromosome partitioning protein